MARPERRSTPGDGGSSPAIVVALSGCADGPGRALALRLAARPGVTVRPVDVEDPALADRLDGVDSVVHLDLGPAVAADLDDAPGRAAAAERLVSGARAVLGAAERTGVPRVVLVTSAMVYGAAPDNPVPLDEDAPLRATPDGGLVAALLQVEAEVERARSSTPGLTVTVLRPAVLVGPGANSVLTRHFEAPRLLVLKGSRPHWQFCHVDDLVTALELAALGTAEGTLTVGCEGFLEQQRVEELSGLRRLEVPAVLAQATAGRLHRLGMTPAPEDELVYAAHSWVVPSTRLRATGWTPRFDNETTLMELLADIERRSAPGGRRFGTREATLGAAGATVAVLGAAAIVRQLRQRRGI